MWALAVLSGILQSFCLDGEAVLERPALLAPCPWDDSSGCRGGGPFVMLCVLVPGALVSILNTSCLPGYSHVTSASEERTLWTCSPGSAHGHHLVSFLTGCTLCLYGLWRQQDHISLGAPLSGGRDKVTPRRSSQGEGDKGRPGISLVLLSKH